MNTIPFEQIGDNLDGILQSANDVANGPQMQQALTELAATIAIVKDMVAAPGQRHEPRHAAIAGDRRRLQKTLTNANKLLLSVDSGYGDNTQFNRDLERLLVQAQ